MTVTPAAAAASPRTQEREATLRVLLVEDDADDVLMCCDTIGHSDLRCQVNTVSTLREAIGWLDLHSPDIALVDLSLPDATEIESVTRIAEQNSDLPIVVLTGLRDEQAAARALEAGAEDYLIKGATSRETISRAVRYAIERKRAERSRRAKDAAEDANRAKNLFLSRMSHELRTPLTAILGFAEILEVEASHADRDLIQHILTAGRYLKELISEVLDLARVDAGELGLRLQPIRIDTTVQEAVALIRPTAAARQLSVEVNLVAAEGIDVIADRQRLNQVLLNLLSNAVKYNRFGGDLRVTTSRVGDRLRVAIRDTGTGLSQDQLASLFTPFNRLGAEDTGVEGTGLGLVITKRLTEAMGATIGLDSEKGFGTTAWTEWKIADAATSPPATQSERLRRREISPATVLYIEDNPVSIALVDRILGYHDGLRMLSATRASDGLELAHNQPPDVILLDFNLPDMTGDRALELLRDDPVTNGIPTIVITADATPASRDSILAAGATAYLTKPFRVEEFMDIIEAALPRGAVTLK